MRFIPQYILPHANRVYQDRRFEGCMDFCHSATGEGLGRGLCAAIKKSRRTAIRREL
jgi:hypothetical protein